MKNRLEKLKLTSIALAVLWLCGGAVYAQDGGSEEEELAKKTQNPIASMVIQHRFRHRAGSRDPAMAQHPASYSVFVRQRLESHYSNYFTAD